MTLEQTAEGLERLVDGWNTTYLWTLAIALVIGAFSFAAQRQALIASRKLGEVKAAIARTKEDVLTLELKEKELRIEELRKAQAPRKINGREFLSKIKGKPAPTKTEIMFLPNDGEAFTFAQSIFWELLEAGWYPHNPIAIPDDAASATFKGAPKELLQMMPATMRIGAQPTGVSILAAQISRPTPGSDSDNPMASLNNAFLAAGFPVAAEADTDMSEGELRIVVGAKP